MAVSIDKDYIVEIIAPELASIPENVFDELIPVACVSVDEDLWGIKAKYATGLMVAHMLAMLRRKGTSGNVRRKKIGQAEIEFDTTLGSGSGGKDPHELSQTSYGSLFLQCRRGLVKLGISSLVC